MFSFNMRTRQNVTNSQGAIGSPGALGSPKTPATPRTEVGEIDTRVPFQSVRAAVSLFGESGASPRTSPAIKKSKTAEKRVLEKETQLHLALKRLDKFKEEKKNTQTTKAQALHELEMAKRTLQELCNKLETVSKSKLKAIEATEHAKHRAKQLEEEKSNRPQLGPGAWKQDVDCEREHYMATASELIYSKQELTNLRQDFDAALEAKLVAFQGAADAQHTAKVNQERLSELSKEVKTKQGTLGQVKQASLQAREEHMKLMDGKQDHLQSYIIAKEEVDKKITSLKEEVYTLMDGNLEEKLEATTETIRVLQEQLTNICTTDLDALQTTTFELADAKKALHGILEERSSFNSMVDSLTVELDNVKRAISEWQEKGSKTELLGENLRVILSKYRAELDASLAGETKPEDVSANVLQTFQSETENARQETDEMMRTAEALKKETEMGHIVEKETEAKLLIVVKEADIAKAAEQIAREQIHRGDATPSDSKDKIKLSSEEFESLRRKVEGLWYEADMKVATFLAQAEAIKEREKVELKRLEATSKEAEDMEGATEDALKKAEMAEAAKRALESELQKWRKKEQMNVVGEPYYIQEEVV